MKSQPETYRLSLEKWATATLILLCLFAAWGGATSEEEVPERVALAEVGTCILGTIVGVRLFRKGIWEPAFLYALIAILNCPLVIFSFDSDAWLITYLASAAALAGLLWWLKRISKKIAPGRIRKLQLAQARADAINEAIANGELDGREFERYIQKLTGNAPQPPKSTSPPSTPDTTADKANRKDEVIHFVIKYPPPGVARTYENIPITGKALRVFHPDGSQSYKTSLFAGSDPLTVFEANSAIYWREKIEEGSITDSFVVEWMNAIGKHTVRRYLPESSIHSHPGEIAITTGLTQLSLHYLIGYLDTLPVPQSITDWMASQRAKGLSYDRMVDCEGAESLKEALVALKIAPEFLFHLNSSVAGAGK